MTTEHREPGDRTRAIVRQLRERVDELTRQRTEPVAVTGAGLRLPGGARSLRDLRELLTEGVDAVTEVPDTRWPRSLYDPDPDAEGRTHMRTGGFIDDPAMFDAAFFGISPREARRLDPQQRLALQVSWEAIEDAGLRADQLAGSRTGVYVGANATDYLQLQLNDPGHVDTYSVVGGTLSIIANRLSYQFDLRGPSMVVDTACSSSLVALHSAVQSLRAGECDTALVLGVNLILSPAAAVAHSKGLPLSEGGRCRPFAAEADGYVRGEGIVAVVVKRRQDAERELDRIHGLVLGTATNQDGRSNGLTAPNTESQIACLRSALHAARTDPEDVELIEAHGTGTALGDPIETEALADVYGYVDGGPLLVGSLKSNMGHLEAAAGLAGLLKALLSVKDGVRFRTLHVDQVNPLLGLEGTRIRVSTGDEAGKWDSLAGRRVAGVSAFGAGGANAHAIVAEQDAVPPASDVAEYEESDLLLLSAGSRRALRGHAAAVADELERRPREVPIMARVARWRRTHHRFRMATPVRDTLEMVADLRAFATGTAPATVTTGTSRARGRTAFVFPGQGAHWRGMATGLYERSPGFRAKLDELDARMTPWLSASIVDLVVRHSDEPFPIEHVQPVLFALSLALAESWRAAGVEPSAVIGHSMGEVGAACFSGAIDVEAAVRIICVRSAALSRIAGQGRMLLVAADRELVDTLTQSARHVEVAVLNGPRTTVLSGDPTSLSGIATELTERGVFNRFVDVDVASHSPQVEVLREEVLGELDGVAGTEPALRWQSTVTAMPVTDALGAAYWYRNMREPVQFHHGLEAMFEDGYDTFVELSPHPTLVGAVEEVAGGRPVAVTGSLSRDLDPVNSWHLALGALYTRRHDGSGLLRPQASVAMTDLPVYSFDEAEHWFTTERGRSPWDASPSASGEPEPYDKTGASGEPAGLLHQNVDDAVADVVSSTLGLAAADLDPELGFFAQGMDSMMARRASGMLEERLGREVPPRLLFEFPTVAELTAELGSTTKASDESRCGVDTEARIEPGSPEMSTTEVIQAIEAELSR